MMAETQDPISDDATVKVVENVPDNSKGVINLDVDDVVKQNNESRTIKSDIEAERVVIDLSSPISEALPEPIVCKYRKAALTAIQNNDVSLSEEHTQSHKAKGRNGREIIREMHSFKISSYPENCTKKSSEFKAFVGQSFINSMVELDREELRYYYKRFGKQVHKSIYSNDIVGSTTKDNKLIIYYFLQGQGKHEKHLKRYLKSFVLQSSNKEEIESWYKAINSMVKWQARVPLSATRRIKVVINPHSGKHNAPSIWKKWKGILDIANINYDVEETTYGGHAIDMGKAYSMDAGYEAMLFIGGDGTVNEFMNGLLHREDEDWRKIVACTPITLLSAGTDNAFSKGVGNLNHASSIYCIIKRKIRPIDVVACNSKSDSKAVSFACCGGSFGIGADIALESEKTRWMGTQRYKWLKLKRGLLAPKKHECKIKYILNENRQSLKTFNELEDEGLNDQHHVELCSIYENDNTLHSLILHEDDKRWKGNLDAVYKPTENVAFQGKWDEEEGQYVTVGAANLYFEAAYSHPSDGKMDLIIVRKGGLKDSIKLGLKYISGDYMSSPLMDYMKVKAIIIEPSNKRKDTLNFDGEVLEGPGPYKMEVIPSLLRVLSEK